MARTNKKIWDLDRLMDNADAFDVVEKIGIRKKRHGSVTYIECVDGTHSETNINHCQLFRDGCHCYSCGVNHNIYGMVRAYYNNVLGISIDHDEICSIIAETCGGEEEYLLNPARTGNGKKKRPFPLTKEELAAIGLSSQSRRSKKIVGYQSYKDEEHSELVDGDGYAKVEYMPSLSIYSLYRDDEELFEVIVGGKINETMNEARNLYISFKDGKDWFSKAVVRIAGEKYALAKSAKEKVFPNRKCAVS